MSVTRTRSFTRSPNAKPVAMADPQLVVPMVEYTEPPVQYLILQVLGANGLKPWPDQAVYAMVKFGSAEARTRILVGSNKDVSWREKFIFPVMMQAEGESVPETVSIGVYQVKRGFVDDCVGRVKVSIVDVEKMKESPSMPQGHKRMSSV